MQQLGSCAEPIGLQFALPFVLGLNSKMQSTYHLPRRNCDWNTLSTLEAQCCYGRRAEEYAHIYQKGVQHLLLGPTDRPTHQISCTTKRGVFIIADLIIFILLAKKPSAKCQGKQNLCCCSLIKILLLKILIVFILQLPLNVLKSFLPV